MYQFDKMFRVSVLLSYLIVIVAGITFRRCSDCILMKHCQQAVSMYTKYHSKPAMKILLRKAHCGLSNRSKKVCCSDFDRDILSDNDNDLVNHPNARLLPDDCGESEDDRIFGGSIAKLDEFPWMVLIAYEVERKIELSCAGTLITERYVLTAAHCIKGKKIEYVRVGEYNLRTSIDCEGGGDYCVSNTQNITVSHAIVYPEYNHIKFYLNGGDIGLLRLSEPVKFSSTVSTICLPITKQLREKQITNEYGMVAGWGYTESGTKSDVLLKADLPVYSPYTCQRSYRRRSALWSHAFCAGTDNVDTCKGDSGGPFMMQDYYRDYYRNIQFGITSFGPENCGSIKPGVYTDVRKYMKWILDTIKP